MSKWYIMLCWQLLALAVEVIILHSREPPPEGAALSQPHTDALDLSLAGRN